MKQSWSLRDNPASLLVAVLGILMVLFTLGWLTARTGERWTRTYVARPARFSE